MTTRFESPPVMSGPERDTQYDLTHRVAWRHKNGGDNGFQRPRTKKSAEVACCYLIHNAGPNIEYWVEEIPTEDRGNAIFAGTSA
jgi:hypothetical protein